MTGKIFLNLFFMAHVVWADEPQFQTGDIIFQTSKSNQSYAIMWASKSLYSHVGIVEVDGKNKYVIEAISKVSRTPLKKWIERGRLGRFAVFRLPNLTVEQRRSVLQAAKSLIGLPYDIFFTSLNKEIYCSELVDMAFQKSNLSVGKYQQVKELDVDNVVVRKLIKQRWRKHPACKKQVKNFDECWNRILDDRLITPDSIATDPRLLPVWNNYP